METRELKELKEFVEFIELGRDKQRVESRGQRAESEEQRAKCKEQSEENPTTPPDLPPELCHYRDEGCELAKSCLECPFARCVYDEPGGKQRWLRRQRAREITRLFLSEKKKIRELAAMFGVSERTVQRDLRAVRGKPR